MNDLLFTIFRDAARRLLWFHVDGKRWESREFVDQFIGEEELLRKVADLLRSGDDNILNEINDEAERVVWNWSYASQQFNTQKPLTQQEFNQKYPELATPGADTEPEEGKRARQIRAILRAISELGYGALSIPTNGKAEIKRRCLIDAGLFTDSGFDHAWKEARSGGQVRMEDHEKFANK